MLATLVGLSMLLALVGARSLWPAACLAGGCGLGRPAAIPSRPPSGSGPARPVDWPPSGPCSPRPWASATGISGPASTASQQRSSSLTTRA
jgi:hypothetical protein